MVVLSENALNVVLVFVLCIYLLVLMIVYGV